MNARLFRMQMKAGSTGERIAEQMLSQNIITSDIEYAREGFNQLKAGDLVVVHKSSFPIALVRVKKKVPDDEVTEDGFGVDYEVEVLSRYQELPNEERAAIGLWGNFPFTGTFFSINAGNPTYDGVSKWFQFIMQGKFTEELIQILKLKGQIILQGPPGTGKTFTAQEVAFQLGPVDTIRI